MEIEPTIYRAYSRTIVHVRHDRSLFSLFLCYVLAYLEFADTNVFVMRFFSLT